ncbi:MAG: UbiA family prenyltransferase [archaeon]
MKIKELILATRPKNLFAFQEVTIGALIGSSFTIGMNFFLTLIFTFFSFQIVYAGIYMINDICDYKKDSKDPIRSKRMIASGKISRENALIFSLVLISVGLILGSIISLVLMIYELLFLLVNLNYSFFLKHIPYIETIVASVTHPLRIMLGISLFGVVHRYFFVFYYFIFAIGCLFLKRFKELEKNEFGRVALRRYKKDSVMLLLLIVGIILASGYFIATDSRYSILAIFIFYWSLFISYFSNRRFKHWLDNRMAY